MHSPWLYYPLAIGLVLLHLLSAALNLVALPGNWLILLSSALFTALLPAGREPGFRWSVVGVLLALAVAGELIEMFAGLAGAATRGASRRSLVLSVVGSIVGSLIGAVVGLPIPVIGSAVAAVAGGALGAFLGAALGEDWKGKDFETSWTTGLGAFWGRLWGTLGKTLVGFVMVAVAALEVFGFLG